MVWNTVLIWLMAMGFLAGTAGLGLLATGDILGAIVVPIAFAVFVIPAAGLVSGFRAANGKANIAAALAIAAAVGLLLFYFAGDGQQASVENVLIALAPLASALAGFGTGKLLGAAKGMGSAAYGGAVAAAAAAGICLFFWLGAYQSQFAYFSLPREIFYTPPKNERTDFRIMTNEEGQALLVENDDNAPFTGKIITYKEKPIFDIFTKKAGGIGYYIDGLEFGRSGVTVPPGPYSSWYGSYAGASSWIFGQSPSQERGFLLHNGYQQRIEEEFPIGTAVYYEEQEDTKPLPKTIVVFARDNQLLRKEITYYPNGVVRWIDQFVFDGSRWDNGATVFFDQLGFNESFYEKNQWREEDFSFTGFSAYERIKESLDSRAAIGERPDKMRFVPHAELWDEKGNLLDNLIAVYGFPLTEIYISRIDKHEGFKALSSEETDGFSELLGRSRVTINLGEGYNGVDEFKSDAVRFVIESEDRSKALDLYYKDGRFLVNEGPYYLEVEQ